MTRNLSENNHPISFEDQELCRLLSAAVINAHFRQALLNNPTQAVANGYRGEKFQIGREASQRLASIRAKNLAEFASQLTQPRMYASAAGAD